MTENPRSLLIAILSSVVVALDALMFPCLAREFSGLATQPGVVGAALADKTIWESYRREFVTNDGRVVDTGNSDASHSEGQGYGMLIAVAAADRPSFDKIWAWTKANLFTRGDHLAAWKWIDPTSKVADRNNASDGDLLIAWALAEAAELWNDSSHLEQARAIARDVFDKAVRAQAPHGQSLMPAVRGFSANDRQDGPIVNLSYWVFPAFARLARITPELDWRGVAQSGLALIDGARFGPALLPTDWISLAGREAGPASGFPKVFGYNAIRIPLYLVWAGAGAEYRLRSFAAAWPENDTGLRLVDVETGAVSEWLREPGYRALAALTHCVVSNVPYPDEFYRFTSNQNYYPATLHILSLLAAANRGGSCLDRAAMRRLVDVAWRPASGAWTESRFSPRSAARTSIWPKGIASSISPIERTFFRTPDDSRPEAADDEFVRHTAPYIIGVLLFALGFIVFVRRRIEAPADDDDPQGKAVDDAVTAILEGAPEGSFTVVPRTLSSSPFTTHEDIPTLERQIEIAAEACTRLSRTIGLIYFEAPAYAQIEAQHGKAGAHQAMSCLASELRRSLRNTDHVSLLDDNSVLVCICLLANLSDLENIARRLRSVVERLGLGAELGAVLPIGLSIYPLNGYTGADLISAVREDFRRAAGTAECLAAPAHLELRAHCVGEPPEPAR